MSLKTEDISRIANLAKLALTPEQSEATRVRLNEFFSIVETMQSVNTEGVEPLFHPVSAIEDITLRLREDVADAHNRRQANMQNAPAAEEGLFLVPKVIE